MKKVFQKTLGGLSKPYYFRQFAFGALFAFMVLFVTTQGSQELRVDTTIICLLNTLLYPYSRFVYESIIDFIMGNNTFFIAGFVFIIIKLITMLICWGFAIFIAPLGLLYLYWHHSKNPAA